MHDISGVHLPETDPSRYRRRNPRVHQLKLRGLDKALIGLHRGFELVHQGNLGIELLFRNGILAIEDCVPLEIDFCVCQSRLVPLQLSLRLQKLYLERSRIDLGDNIIGGNHLTFLDADTHQLTVHTRPHGNCLERRDSAETNQIDRLVPDPRYSRHHRYRGRAGRLSGLCILLE